MQTLEECCARSVYDHLDRTGDQACIQVAVGLNLPYIDVKNALHALVAEGKLRRYIPPSLRYLHLDEDDIYFCGIPHEQLLWKEFFRSLF